MGLVLALGPSVQMAGWALAGVEVRTVSSPAQLAAATADLPDDLAVVVTTPELSAALRARPLPPTVLLAVLPT